MTIQTIVYLDRIDSLTSQAKAAISPSSTYDVKHPRWHVDNVLLWQKLVLERGDCDKAEVQDWLSKKGLDGEWLGVCFERSAGTQ